MLDIYYEAQKESPEVVCGVKEKHEEDHGEEDQGSLFRQWRSDPFLQLCCNEGIKRHFILREMLQQNKVAERMNMTLLEKLWCMLSNVGISKSFWAEVLAYACHLVNRLSSPTIGGKTPLEVWSRKVAQDYDSIWVFRCPAYYHAKEDKLTQG